MNQVQACHNFKHLIQYSTTNQSKMHYSRYSLVLKQPQSIIISTSIVNPTNMPLSMKKQRRNEIKRQDRDLQRKTARKIAVSYLKDDIQFNLRHLSGITGVTRSTTIVERVTPDELFMTLNTRSLKETRMGYRSLSLRKRELELSQF